jgi:hypothetical protein
VQARPLTDRAADTPSSGHTLFTGRVYFDDDYYYYSGETELTSATV